MSLGRRVGTGLLLCLLALAPIAGRAVDGAGEVRTLRHDFGRVVQGTTLSQEFRIANDGPRPFRLQRVESTVPVTLRMVPVEIAPGESGTAVVSLATDTFSRRLDVRLQLYGQPPDHRRAHAVIELTAEVLAPVSVEPSPNVFLAGTRVDAVARTVALVSHEGEPLEIRALEHSSTRFTARTEPGNGERVDIVVSLDPKGPGGRAAEPLLVRTNSKLRPEVKLTVHTLLRERVYAFPESVDFGTLRLSEIRKGGQQLRTLKQTLMVYGKGVSNFDIKVESDLPYLISITSEAGPQGDRFQQEISLNAGELKPGPIRGEITVTTNDKEFPTLRVPVTGNILDR